MAVLAWHFVRGDRALLFEHNGKGGVKIKRGQKLHVKPPLRMCKRGLHASRLPLDALDYYMGDDPIVVCRVRLSGEIEYGDDKMCAEFREVLWWADCTRALHEFACWCAECALKLIKDPDPRSIAAIEAKRKWLRGEINEKELAAARAAAGAAFRAAAGAAAGAAARAAAGDAAWAAAGAAATDAARDAQSKKLTKMLNKLRK